MIKLAFSISNQIIFVFIDNKEIWYGDNKVGKLRLIPKDKKFVEKVRNSRNMFPGFLIDFVNLTKSELEEYEQVKNDEEKLKMKVIEDVKKINGKLIKEEKI